MSILIEEIPDALEYRKCESRVKVLPMIAEDAKYKILLIEDNKLDQMAFRRFVENEHLSYDYKIAASVSDAQAILGCQQFDIIVSDYSLGDGTALDILDSIDDVPIIVVTGSGDEEVAINAWKAGAYDYLVKDLGRNYLKALPKTIENAVNHKKMAESLDRKQKNLEAIFDAAPVGMLLADENMIVTRINDTVRQILHRDYPQIVDHQIGVALGCVNSAGSQQACGYSPACPECLLRNTVKSVLDSGPSVHNVEVHPTINLDNKEVSLWFRISAEPVMIDNHRHVAVAVEDITEYKKAEHERRMVEEKYRTIFENSAVAIMVADERERLISWNKFTEELLGLDEEDLFLRPVQSLYPSAEWEKIRAYDIRQKGMQHHLETRMLGKDGGLIDIDISLSILRNSKGRTTGSIGVIRDITERRKAELQQARLLKEVENINQELKDFASIVSHDLKAPLRAIKTLANWISTDYADKLDQDGIEQFNLLSSKVDWMYQLIEGVLEYSRVGRVKEEQVPVNLSELVPKIIEMVSPPENILIAVENELPTINCEQTRITQVFQNLLSNAIKYIDNPKGQVKIGCVEEDSFWKFSIADNGPGIEEKHFDKIFRIFQTLSSRDKSGNSGVGLSIIKKIVELYGGRIWVESKVGEGSTFFFTLPMQQMGTEQAQLEASIAC